MVGTEQLRLRQRRLGALLLVDQLAVQLLLERDADHVQGLHLRPVLAGEPDRRCEHLLADDPELHRHEDAVEGDGRLEVVLVGRDDLLHQPLAVCAAHGDVDDEAAEQPDRPGVARGGVRRERDHEDDPGRDRADDRRERDLRAADADVQRHAIGPLERGLVDPKLDHSQLGGGEREQHAEGEERGEEGDVVVEERRPDRERGGERGRRGDRLRGDVRAAAQPAEAARQLPVLAERVREPAEAGDRRRDRDEQDQRAGDADVEAQDVAEHGCQLAAQRVGDAEQRRADPRRPERRVRAGKRGQRDDRNRDVDRHDGGDRAEHRSG